MSTDMATTKTKETIVFAARLREAREAADLTQTELARRAGMTPGEICRLEAGKHLPRIPAIELLARLLRVSPAFLAGWE